MEPNEEGILELEDFFEDDLNSMNDLFHWKIKDYELLHCKMLQMDKRMYNYLFPPTYREYIEWEAQVNKAPTH